MIDRGAIWIAALEDLGSRCSVDTTLDKAYVQGRIATEGESFLTNSLPQFGKDLELALEDLSMSKHMFVGFARRTRVVCKDDNGRVSIAGGIPKFLSGFTSHVFDDSYVVSRDEINTLRDIVATHNDQIRREGHTSSDSVGPNYIHLSDLVPPLARPSAETTPAERLVIADAIAALRQLCLMFGKEKSICSQPFIDQAVSDFVKTDEELMLPFSTEE